jgi:large conductance mechanosensitive channel
MYRGLLLQFRCSQNIFIGDSSLLEMRLLREFKAFLDEYKIVGLAVAFIIGAALTQLVNALVTYIIMPLITPFVPGGEWQKATLTFGSVVLSWGAFVAALLNFIILAFVVFMIAKKLMHEEKVTKK